MKFFKDGYIVKMTNISLISNTSWGKTQYINDDVFIALQFD